MFHSPLELVRVRLTRPGDAACRLRILHLLAGPRNAARLQTLLGSGEGRRWRHVPLLRLLLRAPAGRILRPLANIRLQGCGHVAALHLVWVRGPRLLSNKVVVRALERWRPLNTLLHRWL